jgi:hypothetical protein
MLATVLALGLVFVGCDPGDGNGKGKTVTFTLTKLSPTSFSVKLAGANWKDNDNLVTKEFTSDQLFVIATYVLDVYNCTMTTGFSTSPLYDYTKFDTVVSADLKTITATAKPGTTISGTLKFLPPESLGAAAGQVMGVTDGGLPTSALGTTTYIGRPSEGITFP